MEREKESASKVKNAFTFLAFHTQFTNCILTQNLSKLSKYIFILTFSRFISHPQTGDILINYQEEAKTEELPREPLGLGEGGEGDVWGACWEQAS